jgi:aminopeptidase N
MYKMIMGILSLVLVVAPAYAIEKPIGAEGLGDAYFEELGNGGYDVQHYDLNITSNFPQPGIEGTVIISAIATQTLARFNVDLGGFELNSVTLNGEPADYERYDRELSLTPEEPLQVGDNFTVEIAYTGEPGNNLDLSYDFGTGWVQYARGVYVASEPDGASLWFPCNDHPLDKATFDLNVTVNSDYVVAANGLLMDTIENGETTTYVWQSTSPMATYLASVNIGEFEVQTDETDSGIPIRNYFPRRLAADLEETFENQAEIIEFFESIIGDYPFEAYGAVVADTNLYFALENQTLSLFGRDMVRGNPDDVEDVIAHELAHQWFGNSISVYSWRDIWLNEGFATYFATLWYEHKEGKRAADEVMRNYYDYIAPGNADINLIEVGNPGADNLFHGLVYIRGAWTLHALRLEVGDDTFLEIIRTYYARYQYGNARIEDFIAVAEEVSGQNLEDFFNAWLFSEETPEVEF